MRPYSTALRLGARHEYRFADLIRNSRGGGELFATMLQTHKFTVQSQFLESDLLSNTKIRELVIQKLCLILKNMSDL
jgi:hypothetical protein